MSERKPVPLRSATTRAICPVCGKASYSRTGVHPQCSLARAEAASRAARKAAGEIPSKPPARKSWSKTCPKCKAQIPARRFACECGHRFGAEGTDQAAGEQRESSGSKQN